MVMITDSSSPDGIKQMQNNKSKRMKILCDLFYGQFIIDAEGFCLHLCVCVCMYVYVYVCVYMYICIYIYTHTHILKLIKHHTDMITHTTAFVTPVVELWLE